jgi:phosphoglycerol transferase MdoB-like AlkP superfamily enzyme
MNGKLWFKAKTYGWGWTPITWQGWLVLALYIVGVFFNSFMVSNNPYSENLLFFVFIPNMVLLTAFLILICYAKGEEPRWRWGEKDTTNTVGKNDGK